MQPIFCRDVRCFRGDFEFNLAPITVLVGENGSGKSTLLALIRLAWHAANGTAVSFNKEPFLLGAFDQISSSDGKGIERSDSFRIGAKACQGAAVQASPYKAWSEFRERAGQPFLSRYSIEYEDLALDVQSPKEGSQPKIYIRTPTGVVEASDSPVLPQSPSLRRYPLFVGYLFEQQRQRGQSEGKIPSLEESLGIEPCALAPARTGLLSAYDPLKDMAHWENTLARVRMSGERAWQRLRRSLVNFGQSSGLFQDIDIRRLGREADGPFRIKTDIPGRSHKLVDVGCGLSHVLPILVESLGRPRGTTFLLQQPEAYLHPRAQAELASFFVAMVKKHNKRFVVEAHGDYLLDRLCMEVRDGGSLSSSDVVVYLLENTRGRIAVSEIGMSSEGKLLGAPPAYRNFARQEEGRLLGI